MIINYFCVGRITLRLVACGNAVVQHDEHDVIHPKLVRCIFYGKLYGGVIIMTNDLYNC